MLISSVVPQMSSIVAFFWNQNPIKVEVSISELEGRSEEII